MQRFPFLIPTDNGFSLIGHANSQDHFGIKPSSCLFFCLLDRNLNAFLDIDDDFIRIMFEQTFRGGDLFVLQDVFSEEFALLGEDREFGWGGWLVETCNETHNR